MRPSEKSFAWANRTGSEVKGAVRSIGTSQEAILHQIRAGGHNLVVMGIGPRPGEHLSFGAVAAALLEQAECSLVFVAHERFIPALQGH
jgi:nucleotide-binding universal stress UspA family protein